jgi:hypothetical protein
MLLDLLFSQINSSEAGRAALDVGIVCMNAGRGFPSKLSASAAAFPPLLLYSHISFRNSGRGIRVTGFLKTVAVSGHIIPPAGC